MLGQLATGSTVVAKMGEAERMAGRCAAPVRLNRSLAAWGLRRKRGVHEQSGPRKGTACGGSSRNVVLAAALRVDPCSRLRPVRGTTLSTARLHDWDVIGSSAVLCVPEHWLRPSSAPAPVEPVSIESSTQEFNPP